MRSSFAGQVKLKPIHDRRSLKRETLVLRVGLLESGGRTSFCLVKNISSGGVQVKLFAPLVPGADASLRVGDEDPLPGRVIWVREQSSGIRFNAPLNPKTLLRVAQKLAASKRRSSPRVNATARVVLRTGGHTFSAQLCDISTSGARVRTHRSVEPGPSVLLTLPDMPPVKAHVRWIADREIGLSFESPIPIQLIARWLSDRVCVSA